MYICTRKLVEVKQKILLHASKTFIKLGFRSVSMDDLCRELNISKKTIYTFFADKKELVENVVQQELGNINTFILDIMQKQMHPVEEVFEIAKIMIEMQKQEHPSLMYDLKKYYPTVFEMLFKEREENSFKCLLQNLKRGQEMGIYRTNFNCEIVAHLYLNTAFGICTKHDFPIGNCLPEEAYKELIMYHLNSIIEPNHSHIIKNTPW